MFFQEPRLLYSFSETCCPLYTCCSSALLSLKTFDEVSKCCLWLILFTTGISVSWIINAHQLSLGLSLPFSFTLHFKFRVNHCDSNTVIQADDSRYGQWIQGIFKCGNSCQQG